MEILMDKALNKSDSTVTHDSTLIFERIAAGLHVQGYSIVDNAIPEELAETLFARVSSLNSADFSPAGIGRSQNLMLNNFIRRDEIRWLDAGSHYERGWLEWVEHLRIFLNRRLFLGLFSYEGHFAHYKSGAFYKKHVDAFHGESSRILTAVLYLNRDWQTEDGGELVLYPENSAEPCARVSPLMGRLAVFLSEEFPHEVLPAKCDRYSIAGWFRINASTTERVDPPR